MVQDHQQKRFTIGQRSVTLSQMLIGGAILVVLAFLIYGSINHANAPQDNAFGIQTQPFLVLAVLAFAGGFLSFVSPCTLPILPAYFAFAFQSGRTQIAANTTAFMLGLATMFSLTGAIASFVGTFLIQNQQLILLLGGGLVIVFGVISLLGKGFGGIKQDGQERSTTLGGSFVFGMTFAVGWSSCVGPILGAVATMAATTGSVLRGSMLLFIYALGLGLPLLLVSTLFGRASRDSLVWRVLRGKGWDREVSGLLVAALWAYGLWLIAVPLIRFTFPEINIDANPIIQFALPIFSVRLPISLSGMELGMLAIFMAAGALWVLTQPGQRRVTLQLHSTQLVSGVLFLMLGALLLNSQLAIFNGLVSPELAERFANIEDVLINLFSRS
jgi:cytochrome c-type biogenesis protein